MAIMKAVRIHRYGGPEVLICENAPIPSISDDEALVRVHAAGVNPVDWKIREGYLQSMLTYSFPLVIGWDLSGVVDRVGSRVTHLKPGDAVYSRPDIARDGAYAQYIAVRASELAHKPASLDDVHAAAVPLAALTAWQSLFDAASLSPGQTVLIHAAAGGVGSFAVQLAKWKGARVIGTASARNAEFLHNLGADQVIDYTIEHFDAVLHDVDVVFDTIGNETQRRSWRVLKPGGVLVSIISPPTARGSRRPPCPWCLCLHTTQCRPTNPTGPAHRSRPR
ncbi:MAG TPA: NADP-dependent oxidoreductase [Tepidisphaeraceae bacterium]|nr:NADP-dependent oxidoreductase [Tepidisphaeraceae bacterium]